MTLIMAAVTQHYAVLVSDRRITSSEWNGFNWEVVSQQDTDTKSIFLNGRYIMGFTGMARVEQETMEKWLADTLAGIDPDDYFTVIESEFGKVCEADDYQAPHAFLAAGFRDDGQDTPELVIISNSMDPDGNYLLEMPRWPYEFRTKRLPLADQPFLFKSVGAPIGSVRDRRVRRELKVETRRHPHRPDRLADELRRTLSEVSEDSKGWVGKEAIMTTVPRKAVPLPYPHDRLDEPKLEIYREEEVSITLPDASKPDNRLRYYPAFIGPQFVSCGAVGNTNAAAIPMDGYEDFGPFVGEDGQSYTVSMKITEGFGPPAP